MSEEYKEPKDEGVAIVSDAAAGATQETVVPAAETPEWLKQAWEENIVRAAIEEELAVARQRAVEYPSYGEQFDAIYAALGGDDTLLKDVLAKIQEVKKKYPKPVKQAEVDDKSRKGK